MSIPNPKKDPEARRKRPVVSRAVPGGKPSALRDKSKYWPPDLREKANEGISSA